MARELSIIIPSFSEEFLKNTVEDILQHIEADTEVIAVLDGAWAEPALTQHPRLNVIYVPDAIGQRAATNLGVKLSKAKYVMKVDAHCAFDQGFDRKMIEQMQDNWTMVSIMRNLWAFDWKCYHCGWKKYQGPTPEKCGQCGKSDKLHKKMIWKGKERPQSTSYCFDSEPHFAYFGDYKRRPEYQEGLKKGLTESMSIQGSCFMCTREKYWELKLCDEEFGSWGNQGIEVACKTWLSGGYVIINHKTWYAHMFRTQGGDFVPEYLGRGNDIKNTKKKVWEFFFNNWEKQIHPMSWLIEKFMPVADWNNEKINKLK
jgi:glycosyltransferase involved in cell wall biosynthesis